MATLTLRSQKGSPLTNQEVDDNFSNLNSSKVETVTATSPVASSGGTAPVISLSDGYGDTKNPYASKTANYVLAAPNGSNGVPSFRALVAGDIPTLNQNTTGSAASLSATLAVSSGGTGQTTYTNGQLLIGNTTGNTLTKATLTAGTGISITNGTGSITIASTVTGTVTSVSGTGTVSGLTLTGTVTGSGSLTLGGTLSLTSAQVTGALGYTPYNSSNPSGYITGYTETDTLATVTGRGASTTIVSSFNGGGGDGLPALRINQTSAGGSANWFGSFINSGLNAAAGKWGLLLLGQAESSKNSGYLGFQWQGNSSNSNAVTLGLYAADNLLRVYGGGYTEMSGSARAPIFYDLDDTGYYTDPNSYSSFWGVAIRGDSSAQATGNQIFFWSSGNSTTSSIGFKQVGSVWAEHGRTNQGYNTYFTMDSPGRGWIFRSGIGGSNFSGTNVFSISNNAGETTIGSAWGTSATFAQLNISQGMGSATVYRDIDLKGSWSGGEGHAISATHGSSSTNIVGQMVFQHDSPGSRIKWGRLYASEDQSTYPMELITDGSAGAAYLQINNGSMRAPIFYDSNNTGYYVDPNSTSRLSSIDFGNTGYYIHAGDWGMRNTTPYGWIQFGPANATWAHIYASQSIYFNVNTYVNGNWMLYEDTWQNGKYFSSGGIIYANASMRSPIFYDSDNTGYYVNPNGGSQLSAVYANDWFRSQGSAGLYFEDYGYGIRSAHGEGNSYGNATTYGTGRNGWSGWGIGSRWVLMSTGGDNIGIHDNNYGWLYYWDGSYHRFNKGYTEAQGSLRAPIFYDSNNTGYYTDPASTSRMDALSLNTIAITSGITGLTSAPITTQYANAETTNTWYPMTYQRAQHSGGYVTHLNTGLYKNVSGWGSGSSGWYAAIGGNDGYPTQSWYLTYDGYIQNSLGYIYTGGSFRAPIFYDSDDTNYYVDPNSTSIMKGIDVRVGSVIQLYTSAGTLRGYINATDTDDNHLQIATSGGEDIVFKDAGLSGTRNLVIRGGNTGTEAYGSMRSPIFYDANDTGYYCDPNGTAALTTVTVNGNISARNGNGTIILGGNFHMDAYNNNDIYVNYYSSRRFRTFYGSNAESFRTDTDGIVYAFNQFRTPISYDYNDTSYYGDFASTSWMNAVKANVFCGRDSNGYGLYKGYDNNNHFISIRGVVSGTNSSLTITGGHHTTFVEYLSPADSSTGWFFKDSYAGGSGNYPTIARISTSDSWVKNYLTGENSLRAPIFYDSNDTGYYSDQAGTSRLNYIDTNDGNLQLYKTQAVDMSNTSVYSTSNYYPVIINVPTSGCWIEIQNNLNTNVPSWSTHGGGFSLNLRWWTNGSGWGTTEVKRRVEQYHERFTNQTICGGISQLGHSSEEVVWLRGGGYYRFHFSRNLTAYPQSSNYTVHGLTASVTSTAVNTIWDSATGAHTSYNTSVFADTRIDAPIFYDRNNTSYYCDPNSTSNFIRLNCVDGASGHYFSGNGNTADVNSRGINVYSDSGYGAVMAFHRGGYYAVNMGLDSDNVIRIGGWSASSNRWQLDMSGNGTFAGNVTAYSDLRLKDNIETITNALNKVKKIRGITYTRNDQQDKIKRHAGVIAQEVQQVLPEVVSVDNEGILHVAYGNMVGLLVEAVKEQQQQIDKLTKLVETLLAK